MFGPRLTGLVSRTLGVVVALTGIGAATTLAAAAPAGAATCGTRTVTKAFSAFGDTNDYFLTPGGNFEAGLTGWTTSGTTVVAGNEPWKVNGSTNAYSARIAANGSAATPSMCIATAEDSLRFFYKAPGVSGSALHVSIYVTSGVNVATNDYDVSGSTAGWAASQRIMLPDIRDASGIQTVKITFSTRNSTTAVWQIDDVEIDPWRTL